MEESIDENKVEQFVQDLKTKTLDMAFLYNDPDSMFEMSCCLTFATNPDNPEWLKDVRAFVLKYYERLVSGENFDFESKFSNFFNKIT